MQEHKVNICGVDTAAIPVLRQQEMKELLRQVQTGNEEARERLIQCNLKLVLSVIKKFTNRGEYADDLFQVGCIGLMKAIDHFDLSHNVQFSTYAVPMNVP